MSAIQLSIIIVAFKKPKILKRCIDSIPQSPKIETIVIDNSKNNIGFGSGCNKGAAKSRGKYLLFLNPDCVVNQRAINQLVGYLDTHPNTGVVGPKIINLDKTQQHSFSLQPTILSALIVYSFLGKWKLFSMVIDAHRLNKPIPMGGVKVGKVMGSALMIRSNLFKKLNGFDENFFMYWEETDLCRRCLALGRDVVFYPAAEVVHEGSALTPKNRKLVMGWFRASRFYFFRKHFGLVKSILLESFLRTFELAREMMPIAPITMFLLSIFTPNL